MSLPTSGYTPGNVEYVVAVFGKAQINMHVFYDSEDGAPPDSVVATLDSALPDLLHDLIIATSASAGNVSKTQTGRIQEFIAQED